MAGDLVASTVVMMVGDSVAMMVGMSVGGLGLSSAVATVAYWGMRKVVV